MIDVRIVEAFQHIGAKAFQLCHREVERLHQFVELHFLDVFADNGVV